MAEQGFQCRPDVVEQPGLGGAGRVQAVRLKKLRMLGNPGEQEIDMGEFFCFHYVDEDLCEIVCVMAVIGRQAHADQQDAGLAFAGGSNHGFQVGTHFGQRQAAQTIVGAEGNDDNPRAMSLQCGGQAGEATGSGFAGNAEVGNVIIQTLIAQALLQQGRPGGVGADAISGRERIANNEQGFRCRPAGKRSQQQQGAEENPDGGRDGHSGQWSGENGDQWE